MENMQVHTILLLLGLLACQAVNGSSSSQVSESSQHHASRRDANPQPADFDSLEIELLDPEGDSIDSLEVGDSIALDFVMHQSLSAKSSAPFIPSAKSSVSELVHEHLVWWGKALKVTGQFIVLWTKGLFGIEI